MSEVELAIGNVSPLSDVLMEEERIVEYSEDDSISKLPKLMRTVVRKPNWTSYHKMLNKTPCCSSICGSTGVCVACNTTVKDGHLHLAWYHDGRPNIFGPGMHNLCCFWSDSRTISASSNHIEHGPLFIITVPQGMLGYGVEKGIPVLLAPGRHKIMSYEFI